MTNSLRGGHLVGDALLLLLYNCVVHTLLLLLQNHIVNIRPPEVSVLTSEVYNQDRPAAVRIPR